VLEAVLSSDAEAALALQHYENILSGTLVGPGRLVLRQLIVYEYVIAAAGWACKLWAAYHAAGWHKFCRGAERGAQTGGPLQRLGSGCRGVLQGCPRWQLCVQDGKQALL
jgi:hypothetical protein